MSIKFVSLKRNEEDDELLKSYLQDQRKGEICFSFYREKNAFMWLEKTTINENMKIWRKSAKNGTIKICKYNNKTYEVFGNTYYTMVVQAFQDNKQIQTGVCMLMLELFKRAIDGYGFCFRTQENRDSIYNYVMKGIDEPN